MNGYKIVFLNYKRGFSIGNLWVHHPKWIVMDDLYWENLFELTPGGGRHV